MKKLNNLFLTISLLSFGMAAGGATLDPKILNNIHLGPDPAILPLDQRAQVQPHITRSFSDPMLLMATWQSGRIVRNNGGAIGNEYAVSRDGGLTWVRSFVPGLTQGIDAGPFDRASDPVGAISFDNVIFQNSLIFNVDQSAPPSLLTLSKMNSADAELGAPITAFMDQWPTNELDNNWVAVNTFPGSPTYGQITMTTRVIEYDPNNGFSFTTDYPILTVSNDGGQNWTDAWQFGLNRSYGMHPVYLPNGDLV